MAYSILIAEDDPSISELIKMTLGASGYVCKVSSDGNTALNDLEEKEYHLALLDIMLPGVDGFTLLESFKKKNIPVIFVTAKTSVMDKVQGLRLGAEDYITKPFDLLELLARVEVALRRSHQVVLETLTVGDVTVDYHSRKVYKSNQLVTLTPKEYELLEFLLHNPNIAFSRESLLNQVWGYDFYGSTRTIDTHILNLRTKLGLSDHIHTVHKIGYRMEF
ncbi:response regulator transcription factor [Brevibacillus sp. M2.1A]|uniref:response regulator transcription factor n=1 Tax=Brevibacillus TaxID=55080 RepID=UPI00156B06E1|nr:MULTISPECIES: response regulator transcription factor [Brevibacillus]MBY0086514.1 response regulator transcription factor [Brevibacillus brevis]MCC8437665.1 response regulator transcription factor [Brevibacillus sp. M2.1A]UKK99789.1 response regulator transcription factor [Brevibacillus brevis]